MAAKGTDLGWTGNRYDDRLSDFQSSDGFTKSRVGAYAASSSGWWDGCCYNLHGSVWGKGFT